MDLDEMQSLVGRKRPEGKDGEIRSVPYAGDTEKGKVVRLFDNPVEVICECSSGDVATEEEERTNGNDLAVEENCTVEEEKSPEKPAVVSEYRMPELSTPEMRENAVDRDYEDGIDDLVDESVEVGKKSFLSKLKKPVMLVPAGFLFLSFFMFQYVMCGGSGGEEKTNRASMMPESGYPVLKVPKGSDKNYENDELGRMMDEAERKMEVKRNGVVQVRTAGKPVSSGDKQQGIQQLKAKGYAQAQGNSGGSKKNPGRAGRRGKKRRKKTIKVQQEAESSQELERSRPARSAAFYKAGVTISADGGKRRKQDGPEIPPGTSFRAALKAGVSTDFTGATVLAEVLDPLKAGGAVVLPKGSTLKGRIRGSGDRIYLDFNKAVKPGGGKLSLRGYAVSGKLPGVPARVREGPGSKDSSRAGSVMARGSLRTAQGMVGTLGGGSVTGQLVRNVAGESLNEVRSDVNTRAERTLELPAGTEFTVVITD